MMAAVGLHEVRERREGPDVDVALQVAVEALGADVAVRLPDELRHDLTGLGPTMTEAPKMRVPAAMAVGRPRACAAKRRWSARRTRREPTRAGASTRVPSQWVILASATFSSGPTRPTHAVALATGRHQERFLRNALCLQTRTSGPATCVRPRLGLGLDRCDGAIAICRRCVARAARAAQTRAGRSGPVAARASSCAASSSSGTTTNPPPPARELSIAAVVVGAEVVEEVHRERVIGADRADTGHRTVRTSSARQPTHRVVAQHPRGEVPSGVGVERREAAAVAVEAARTTAASDAAKKGIGQASVPAPRSP